MSGAGNDEQSGGKPSIVKLSGDQVEELHQALLGAFPKMGPLRLLVWTGLDEKEGLEFKEAALMLNRAGYYLDERAQYPAAERLYVRSLAIREKVLGAEHPDTKLVRRNLDGLRRLM